jgi:hypothetical protein
MQVATLPMFGASDATIFTKSNRQNFHAKQGSKYGMQWEKTLTGSRKKR